MTIIKLPFVAGSYQSRSKSIDLQETVNLYPEKLEPTAKEISAFIGTPGLSLFLDTLSNVPPRGFYVTGSGRLFYVNGLYLYEVFSSTKFLQYKTALLTDSGYVDMCDNGSQLLIVDGSRGYLFDLTTNALSVIETVIYPQDSVTDNRDLNDSVFPTKPTTCAYRDGFFIVNWGGTNLFSVSSFAQNIADTVPAGSIIWPATYQFSKETESDPIVSIKSTPSYLWIFGTRTTELWYTTGNGAAPFLRAQEATIDTGALSANSVCTSGNDIYWLGSNPTGTNVLWQASSFVPKRISNHSIEYLIGQLTTTSDCTSFTYQQEGHFFVMFNFTIGQKSYCYDLTSGEWHQRGYFNQNHGVLESHLALFGASFNQLPLICDRRNGRIYQFDLSNYSDNGDNILRRRTLPHVAKTNNNLFVYKVELDLQKGVGVETDTLPPFLCSIGTVLCGSYDSDPIMALSWSKDGGYTWSKEHFQSMGKAGKFKQRLIWPFGLGKSRDWVFRFTTIARVKIILISATADILEETM